MVSLDQNYNGAPEVIFAALFIQAFYGEIP